jgi:hypothetical protein
MKALLILLALAADSDLEALVERFYLGAKVTLAENASCLETDQQEWQRAVKRCRDGTCLKRAQLARLAELQALQESVPSNLDLPEVPQLLWAIAPATEPRTTGSPLKVEGRLEYQAGYHLRGEGGKTFLLVDDLSLRGSSADKLREIRDASRNARLMARGTASSDPSGDGFDPRNCVFLYVLP